MKVGEPLASTEALDREQRRLAASIGRHLGPRPPAFTPTELWYGVSFGLATVGAAILGVAL